MSGGAVTIDTPAGITMFNLLQLKYALKLEVVGMRHSQGSVYALVKRRFGFKGNKQRVLDQLEAHIEKVKASMEAADGASEG